MPTNASGSKLGRTEFCMWGLRTEGKGKAGIHCFCMFMFDMQNSSLFPFSVITHNAHSTNMSMTEIVWSL